MQLKTLTAQEIRQLDPRLFSDAEKDAYIHEIYGNPAEWSWKTQLLDQLRQSERWQRLLMGQPVGTQAFCLPLSELLFRAELIGTERHRGNRVSDFTDWIYRLYVPRKDYASLMAAARAERVIAATRIPRPRNDRWKLLHCGLAQEQSLALSASRLRVNGNAMVGSPDLVFREKKTGRILIVEVKVARTPIPSDGWPNIGAQLWAYSMIDNWSDAPEIVAVAEIWSLLPKLKPGAWVRYRLDDPSFQKQNRALFSRYGGEIDA